MIYYGKSKQPVFKYRKIVIEAIVDFLEKRGWRIIRKSAHEIYAVNHHFETNEFYRFAFSTKKILYQQMISFKPRKWKTIHSSSYRYMVIDEENNRLLFDVRDVDLLEKMSDNEHTNQTGDSQ